MPVNPYTYLRPCIALAVPLVALLLAGCDGAETEVRRYPAPKETPTSAPSTAPSVAAAVPPAAAADAQQQQQQQQPIQWTTPPGWTHDPQPRPMRVATFTVGNDPNRAELIVTRFRAGTVGSLLDNINRWRQQVGLPPVADEKAATPEKTTVAGQPAQAYDFAGDAAGGNPARRNRVVVVETPAGEMWFFRFFGPSEVVDAQRGQFESFLQSVKFTTQG
jgi:hypothetical protein